MDELDVDAVDRGHEHRQRVQSGLRLAPVVAGAPVPHERLDLGLLHALGLIADGLLVGPPRRRDSAAESASVRPERGLERADRFVLSRCAAIAEG